ncbi:hypothetical protein PISMIDRAFT_426188 [Pisolithus microcarpus 441]|uniref:Hikeshi-like domain-containing protein n=1 Tax=Pisolithus microcarpus 441 TaxID=765257 RepID=A0A0C9YGD2_9AGAM|nr:DUF775-domain-containing protein [Pisolithus microcarpus]KIK23960.1 hypothetical protein PISMIDRAFT_426188 [Pisolithus microcarpus 441]
MFGCCVAGRLLQTNLQQVDETHALFEIPAAEKVNHLCVFLLGTVPFPDGYGCTVHFFWPGKGSQVLGMLSNEKPSAIFRLRSTFSTPASGTSTPSAFTSATSSTTGDVTAILGLAIEPLETVLAQMAALPAHAINSTLNPVSSSVTRPFDPTILAERIAKHLFNYVSGFVGMDNIGPDSLIPVGLVARWYENFTSKLRTAGTGFLERLE